jgi:RNA polymerase sigma-70 factor (ECF subfamily)
MRLAIQLEIDAGVLIDSSAELVENVRQGDEEAFRLIFQRYSRPVISYIYGIVGERTLAEEAAQETFVRAYRNLPVYRSETKFSTWLFGIARNVAREARAAHRKDERKVEIDSRAVTELSDQRVLPDAQLLIKELDQAVRNALMRLDEDKRLVFTLRVFQQLSYEEITQITGFSSAKLKTDLHRARNEMRRYLRPYLGASDEV